MGQYHTIRCPVCQANIETDRLLEFCPACKERLPEGPGQSGDGTGLTTALAAGPGLKPLGGVVKEVY